MTIKLVLLLAILSIAAGSAPNPYLARATCNYSAIGWKNPPFETGRGWVYFVTGNNVIVIQGNKSIVGDTEYWIANATGMLDLSDTFTVYGAVEAGGGTIWTKQIQMSCPKIYLPALQGE